MRQTEWEVFLSENPDYNIDWPEMHRQCSTLPQNIMIFFKDEYTEPRNWKPELFEPWFPRRLVYALVPSLHSGLKKNTTHHKVVLSFIPTSWALPNNFVNRFGFTHEPMKRLVGWGCVGPDCPIGVRLLGICGHGMSLVSYLGIYAYHPNEFVSTHQPYNMFVVDQPAPLNHQLLRPLQPAGNGVPAPQQPPPPDQNAIGDGGQEPPQHPPPNQDALGRVEGDDTYY